MVERYARAPMRALWSERRKLELWFEVEVAAVEAWAAIGVAPPEAARTIRERAVLDPERVAQIEARTRHDVAAFVQSLEESVGPEHGRWIHFGLTSSDILDTSLACLMRDALDLIIEAALELGRAIKRRAKEHAETPMIGRSHGIHAELTTVGHMFAVWYAELGRAVERLRAARREIAVGKISGAVGTFANVPPEVEERVLRGLGLDPEPASTQVVQRDRHAAYFAALALLASSLEKFAVTIRHMQRTEVGEAEERFSAGQKGSSAMPHKRNPVLTENVTGLARVVRSALTPALENVALWHERDISHSSVERFIAPDATTTLDFALARMTKVVGELVIYPERLRANIERTGGLPFSQAVLLELVRAGSSRDDAYATVQRVAMRAWEKGEDFRALARADAAITGALGSEVLESCFREERALRNVPAILARVFDPERDPLAEKADS